MLKLQKISIWTFFVFMCSIFEKQSVQMCIKWTISMCTSKIEKSDQNTIIDDIWTHNEHIMNIFGIKMCVNEH